MEDQEVNKFRKIIKKIKKQQLQKIKLYTKRFNNHKLPLKIILRVNKGSLKLKRGDKVSYNLEIKYCLIRVTHLASSRSKTLIKVSLNLY